MLDRDADEDIRISIHPLRGEWDAKPTRDNDADRISIHPLRGEWDPQMDTVPKRI